MPKVLIKRGTRAQLDTAKNASGLSVGELYLITDEGKLAVGTAVNAYVEVQAQDGDLDAIAALSGTSGLLKKTAANTWSLDTATYLTSAAIGSTVQAYDADLDTWATKAAPSGTVVGTSDTQTLSAKTLTLPKINDTSANNTYDFGVSELAANRTVTLPLLTGNDTFVFENHAQTLTNKALVAPSWSAGATGVGVLDIAGSGPGTNNWTCLRLRDGTTNGTNKCGAITTARKTNSNPDFLVFAGGDDGSNTIAYFGGGGWGLSEATQINFFTRTTYPGANADGGTQSFGIDRGTVYVGVAALTTSATSGHFWIPSCPGVPTGNPSAVYTNAAALLVDSTNKEFYFLNGTTWYQAGKYVRPYSATIESPTSSEKVVLGFTTVPLTVSAIRSVLPGGSSTPSVTFSIRYGTDVSGSGTEVVTSGITTTSTTTGTNTTSFNSASIAAGNFIWITTSAKSGTVPQLHVTVQF